MDQTKFIKFKYFTSKKPGNFLAAKPVRFYYFQRQQSDIEDYRLALGDSVEHYKKVHTSLVKGFNKLLDVSFVATAEFDLTDSGIGLEPTPESLEVKKYFENFDSGIKKYIDVSRHFYNISGNILSNFKPAHLVLYERLQELRDRLKEFPSSAIILEIKQLLREQADLVSLSFSKNVRYLKNFSKIILTCFRQDARKHIRSIISFIYKCYSDFSGCEEEEPAAYAFVRSNFFNKHNFSGYGTLRISGNFRFSYTISRSKAVA